MLILLAALACSDGAGPSSSLPLKALLAQKPWMVPIPGTTKQVTIQGARYPEALEKRTGL